jgi:WXXGXW repeat (2 copies)
MKRKFYTVALAALLFVGLSPTSSFGQIGLSIGIAPPAIPIYEQPYPPGPGYIWTPGYWAWDSRYYWVPGAWILPPRVGFLWTPGYWAYNGRNYFFNAGYWGPTVGFYGGINYGWGYTGHGYYGGRWVGNAFQYNTAVTRVDTTVIHNTYVNKAVIKNTGSSASFNGPGGTTAKATTKELATAKADHVQATAGQQSRIEAAKNNPDFDVANNQGKPKADAIKTFDRNNEVQAGVGKEKQEIGNAAIGQNEGNLGKVKSVEADDSLGKKGTLHKADKMKSKSYAGNAATAQYTSRHTQVKSYQQQQAMVRQGGPNGDAHGKGQGGKSNKKKKKKSEDQGPGSGY